MVALNQVMICKAEILFADARAWCRFFESVVLDLIVCGTKTEKSKSIIEVSSFLFHARQIFSRSVCSQEAAQPRFYCDFAVFVWFLCFSFYFRKCNVTMGQLPRRNGGNPTDGIPCFSLFKVASGQQLRVFSVTSYILTTCSVLP